MGKHRKLIAYKLVPVYETDDFIVQPAMMDCCLTQENLSANNGAGMFISPKAYDCIRKGRYTFNNLEEPVLCK